VDLGTVTTEVSALPWVREVTVSRVPPSTIELAVEARVPVAVVVLESASWLVDEHGVVVGGGTAPELPRIIAPESVVPGPGGEIEDVAVRNALAVHLALPEEVVAQVHVYDAPSDRGLRLHLAQDDVWARVGLAERVPQKGQVIALLLEQVREQAALQGEQALGIAELDVRAPDNPVLIPGDGSLGEEHSEAMDPTPAEGDEPDSVGARDRP
jgi:cell division septal protein FtsQ